MLGNKLVESMNTGVTSKGAEGLPKEKSERQVRFGKGSPFQETLTMLRSNTTFDGLPCMIVPCSSAQPKVQCVKP